VPVVICNVPEFATVPPDNVVILEEPLPVRFSEPPLTVPAVKIPPTVTEPPETFAIREPVAVTVPAVMLPLEIEPLPANVVTPVPDKLPKITVPDVALNVSEPNSATVPKVSDVPEKLAVVPALPVKSAPLFTSTALKEPPLRKIVPVFAREPVPAFNVPAVM
jgi:hypothetical protein